MLDYRDKQEAYYSLENYGAEQAAGMAITKPRAKRRRRSHLIRINVFVEEELVAFRLIITFNFISCNNNNVSKIRGVTGVTFERV